jgi:hypothetical protein
MCCGQKRTELRSNSSPLTARTASATSSHQQTRPVPAQATVRTLTRPTGKAAQSRPIYTQAQTMRSPTQFTSPFFPVSVQYLEHSPIRVRGAVSGRHYDFSSSRPAQSVDRRDVPGLLRTGFFRQS